ncbi:DegT/DnrJ/EryC1/StrS family aminotransferase [Paenibacillus physcomitrellae]|uniref:Aminotransferase n=1 Tax=Paenibacillus physcomitrellae TaxID=1619311 RepID=A0ABQ1FXL8_9BACL|nr:DegT/DnrJ/EryC1/StrS family aminotransferase [Paenibacillus physcomitrellae]GGA33449.1 aminotransferase [Paenibacillus physcomitrellae]
METRRVSRERIPVLDLNREVRELKPRILQAVEDILDKGVFIMGEQVKRLEQECAAELDAAYAVALNSGTDALMIALLAAGIGPGDEVITTPFTFFATAEAISRVGAEPVFVDVDRDTFNLDLTQLEQAVTPRTKAVIPVHLFGQTADMKGLMAIADARGLIVIEDAAQAFGAEHLGRKAGTIGHMGCFSFFPSKNLGAYGDGGLLVTNDADLAEKARMLRAHGSRIKYYNEMIGLNSRLDEMQAAILRVKLPYAAEWNERRRRAAALYNELLSDIPELQCPACAPGMKHVYHQYTLRVSKGLRDSLQAALDEAGISTAVYYPVPVHRLPVYASIKVSLPAAEQLADEVLSLPIGPYLDAETQLFIAGKIAEHFR